MSKAIAFLKQHPVSMPFAVFYFIVWIRTLMISYHFKHQPEHSFHNGGEAVGLLNVICYALGVIFGLIMLINYTSMLSKDHKSYYSRMALLSLVQIIVLINW